MLFLVLLPWCAFWLIWRLWTLQGLCWRSAFLAANVVCGVLIVVSTEALSAVRLLNFPCLLIFWILVCFSAVFFLRKHPDAFRFAVPAFKLSAVEKALIGCGILIVAVIGMIALIAPPNTSDSMAYHMSRAMHWLQNASVRNYPTGDFRQLVYPPYAEYAIFQAQVLSASDRFANLPQWTAMLGSAVGVSLIAKALGADRRGQILTALFMLTIPMGILQGSSTQNDYVVTFWVVCCVVFLLQLGAAWGKTRLVLCAMSFGLAILTKGTGFFFGLPFFILWLCFFKHSVGRKAALFWIVVVISVLLNGAFCLRLQELEKNPINALSLSGSIVIDKPGIAVTTSNIVKNIGSELALPWDSWNRFVERRIFQVHHYIGIDPEDRGTTFGGKFHIGYSLDDSFDEDCANSFLHTIIILMAGILFWFFIPKSRLLWFYALATCFGFLYFATVLIWQPWIGRFHLPWYVLLSPFVVFVLTRFWSARILIIVALILVLGSVPYLFWNNSRRIFSAKSMFLSNRSQLYFAKNRAEYEVYKKITEAMKTMNCRDIGIKGGTWEYAWWPLLGWPKGPLRIEHIGVSNASAKFRYPQGDFTPCAIIAQTSGDMPVALIEQGRPYVRAAGSWILTVYLDVAWLQQRK